ncbi:uncharacterized protein F5891DRAFT_1227064 [Suillus fuscotomentosus]|uniref:Uncharacterized protein n=1 Tax=Suillus fuscotomentosus TaxID=1912939 RepID=A0AAD4E8S7_9AGAM|nr:uncharacterized protein F5891DRAFT_1227064 [Suillus fuscotomentosus]KAG1900423.1 hypothetical protein F5891DRAFT_1227064 [Suillus fuscotomentosus]
MFHFNPEGTHCLYVARGTFHFNWEDPSAYGRSVRIPHRTIDPSAHGRTVDPSAHGRTIDPSACADDFDANGNFISTGRFLDPLARGEDTPPGEGGRHIPLINNIDWNDPSLYTMPLTHDEIAALTRDIAATNHPLPELPPPTHVAGASTSSACTPSPKPSEIHDQGLVSPTQSEVSDTSREVPELLQREANTSTWAARNPTVTPKVINDIIGGQTHYRNSRKMQVKNALVHAKSKEMNADLPVGSRYSLAELREMVASDPKMKDLTREQEAAYISALDEHREKKSVGVRSNNIAAARDVVATTDRIVKELDDLRVRTGVYATLFVIRGHINDTVQSAMHGTDNSEDFWEDVYEHPMADFLRQYEQWACTQNQNLNERDSLEMVWKQVRKMIIRGLVEVTGKKDIGMNYHNYETAIVETYGVRLVGWPHGVNFISPSNIRTVGDIRKLRDALKARTCYWTVLSPAEIKAHTAELEARCSAGDVVHKPRKKRSDAGVPRKRKAATSTGPSKENQRMLKRAKRNSAQLPRGPKSAEFVQSSDEGGDDD